VRAVRDVCAQVGMAFLYKQKGGRTPKANGRLLDGVEWNQIPTARAA
jgi:protein gp37